MPLDLLGSLNSMRGLQINGPVDIVFHSFKVLHVIPAFE